MRTVEGKALFKPVVMEILRRSRLFKADGSLHTYDNALSQASYVGIYFSASWCPPCQEFTRVLKPFYEVKKSFLRKLIHLFYPDHFKECEEQRTGDCFCHLWQVRRANAILHEGVSWRLVGRASRLQWSQVSKLYIMEKHFSLLSNAFQRPQTTLLRFQHSNFGSLQSSRRQGESKMPASSVWTHTPLPDCDQVRQGRCDQVRRWSFGPLGKHRKLGYSMVK